MNKNKKILLTAAGTGGHLFPAIALAEDLKELGYSNISLITDIRCSKYLSKDLPVTTHIIDLYINTSTILGKIKATFFLTEAIFKAYFLIARLKPDITIGFGGYPSFPTMLASIFIRIPIVIHEQNCFMGRSNRFFARFAKVVALSYSKTENINNKIQEKAIITGDLIRNNIRNLLKKSNFDSEPFTIFIFGGSQGAKIFTVLVPEAIKILKNKYPNIPLEIFQQAQEIDQQKIKSQYNKLAIKNTISNFFHDINDIYRKAHLVIARSGAGAIAELTHIGLPAIFIPFPSAADDHQYYNARSLKDIGASWCYRQTDITAEILANKIYELIQDRSKLKQASNKLLNKKNNGNRHLANTILKIIE